jgi:hypothetical protein
MRLDLLCLLALSPALLGNTFTLGADQRQVFDSVNVGPYLGTLTGSTAAGFFCLDDTLTAVFGTAYNGAVAAPATQAEKEAAFLASYALYEGSPSSNPAIVNMVEGPISFAIWQIMGTLGSVPPDPAAQPFIQTAQYAYSHNLIPQAYLNTVLIFKPDNPGIQRFITAVPNSAVVSAAVPESGTLYLIVAGLLFALGWYHHRSAPR